MVSAAVAGGRVVGLVGPGGKEHGAGKKYEDGGEAVGGRALVVKVVVARAADDDAEGDEAAEGRLPGGGGEV